jgi:hypothetical protein
VAWFVKRELSASRKPEPGRESPPLFHDALDELRSLGLQVRDGRMDVVAHEVDLVMRMALGGMGSQLGGRAGEYQPSASGIHRFEAKRVLKKRARRDRVVGEQNRVKPDDHLSEEALVGVCTEP